MLPTEMLVGFVGGEPAQVAGHDEVLHHVAQDARMLGRGKLMHLRQLSRRHRVGVEARVLLRLRILLTGKSLNERLGDLASPPLIKLAVRGRRILWLVLVEVECMLIFSLQC
ncbi:MAG TPA: hypothetical protein VE338_01830 [Ktedonobacterales bacterium]|jgi:hypothetical protein|nr:hypothetical protein [Ktedonobacterales bacterium]